MKGQFFLVGALLMILLFYVGISVYLSPPYSVTSPGEGMHELFENIRGEYPRVANFGLNESCPAGRLSNFTLWVGDIAASRGFGFSAMWILTENASDDLNVTAGNFMGYATNLTLNVSGDVDVIELQDGDTDSLVFSSPPSEFEFRVSFNTTEKNLLLEKYKANMYLILEMSKGDDVVSGVLKA